ncbi:MAG TPA: polynucleotide kinase-phosphatase [Gammaproteobacteria bacterium]
MQIKLPELSLVLLVGASGSGKSSFAARHFRPTEVISSDYCRGLVSDDETDQSATADAFDVLHAIVEKRLKRGRLTVVDATNVRADDRKSYLRLAKDYHVMPVAIVLNMPEALCHERNQKRPERNFGPHVVRNHCREVRRSIRQLKREGFRYVYELASPQEIDEVEVSRQPMWTDRRSEHGPFDIIGDVHGCFDELTQLLEKLGYRIEKKGKGDEAFQYTVTPPKGRKAFFVGDLVDRGPASHECLRLAMDMVEDGVALCVPGNHEAKLYKKLTGGNVKISHGLAETLQQLEPEPPAFIERVKAFIDGLISHFVLDEGRLVVAHAGMKEEYQGRGSGKVRAFALYGETTGETDEFGFPVRYPWAQDYRGAALVVYGHTPVPEAEFINNTICIDTGCVFGGKLTALRYPEKELISVQAAKVYYERFAPASPVSSGENKSFEDVLSIEDVLGKHHISTRFGSTVIIREGNTLAAMEVFSRFGVNPRWLTYLPPTMSPPETSNRNEYLEHPEEAFAYYRNNGVREVVCEEKHMGSRCIVHVCKSREAAQKRFRIGSGESGICYTRTGRRFFNDAMLENEFLTGLQRAIDNAGLWRDLDTEWLTLDCELMPWSFKAMELIRQQYAATGCAATNALSSVREVLEKARVRGIGFNGLESQIETRLQCAHKFVDAYRPYCWPVTSLDDVRLAPFHIMASEGAVHTDKDHLWHMQMLTRLVESGSDWLIGTSYRLVDLYDEKSVQSAINWWTELTGRGGEGMVVKPKLFETSGKKGLLQPAIKCRGPSYLRIIYGMDYDMPSNLERLRRRNLSGKRRLAVKEYMLGIEALTRFVDRRPLQHIHECALGVLALESEPVDPRL